MLAPTPFFGDRGCHVRIYEEARHLQRRGVDVLVVTYPTGADAPGISIRRSAALPGLRPRPLGPSYGRPLLD
ncbi:MAG: glycosyltransferase family 1 protein, partial [Gemmatimonadetes bacterium]|nr:glycosyltransferase family 1 protein [Gemmatimonadota bacterium]